jgi:uncharacterized membrane protein YbaN (DUF454 family)
MITGGLISLALGTIGIILPVLPTTPFLLLSSFLFVRSSRRLYLWLINHRVFGSYIYNYLTYKAVPLKTKIIAITLLWATLVFSIYLLDIIYLKILLAAIGTGVTIHITLMKTLKNEDRKRLYEQRHQES